MKATIKTEIDISEKEILKLSNDCLAKEAERIANIVKNNDNNTLLFFDALAPIRITAASVLQGVKNDPAIYVFRMAKAVSKAKFDDVKYGAKTNSNLKGTKFKKDGFLYLGKAENVQKRLDEHLDAADKAPYSLKLGHSNRSHLVSNVELYVFYLKKEFKRYKLTILSAVESRLHDLLEPYVGTKRV